MEVNISDPQEKKKKALDTLVNGKKHEDGIK